MEINIDRSNFDVSYKVKLNINTIKQCISDLENFKIRDRNSYYSKCVLERFDKCNNNYVKEFDNTLNKIYNELLDNDNFDYQSFQKLLKNSTKLTSQIYDNYIDIIYSLNN